MPMPKTPMDEYRDAKPRQGEVGRSWQRLVVPDHPNPPLCEYLADSLLNRCPLGSNARHDPAALLDREHVCQTGSPGSEILLCVETPIILGLAHNPAIPDDDAIVVQAMQV